MPEVTGTSILNSIKKMLGIDESYDVFDPEISVHINTVFSVLHNIGASPPAGFFITGTDDTWEDFLQNAHHVQMVKTYMYLRVRMIFDPPQSSFVMDAFKKQADELEWRLNTLELQFNPEAYSGTGGPAVVDLIDPDGTMPDDATAGTIAIDPVTGDVWQEV